VLKHHTLFVIGAAMSAELGLPLGAKLKENMIGILPIGRDGGGDALLRNLIEQQGNTLWQDAALLIRTALPYAASIDNLVEHHSDNDIVVTVAKWAIARAIGIAETKSDLGPEKPVSRPDSLKIAPEIKETSYHALFRLIVAGVPRRNLGEAFARLQVVTFNYDRTLELFMERAVAHHSGVSAAEARRIVGRATILHAYGVLDPENIVPENRASFQPLTLPGQIQHVAAGLRTFSEKRGSGENHPIIEAMHYAERIIFLGCAFHRQNLALIKPRELTAEDIFGTAYIPAPEDPLHHSRPSLADFSAPTIASVGNELSSWYDQMNPNQRSPNLYFHPMTISQMIAHYGFRWSQ